MSLGHDRTPDCRIRVIRTRCRRRAGGARSGYIVFYFNYLKESIKINRDTYQYIFCEISILYLAFPANTSDRKENSMNRFTFTLNKNSHLARICTD